MTPQANAQLTELQILAEARMLLTECARNAPADPRYNVDNITLRLNPRLRVALARAFMKTDTIEINPTTWALNPSLRAEIMAHEFAHIVAYRRHYSTGHDLAWRMAMRSLGYTPRRTVAAKGCEHNTRTVHCGCGPRQIGVIRFNRLRAGAPYRCMRCNQPVTLEPAA